MTQEIVSAGRRIVKRVEQEVFARAFQASNELRTAELFVLRGQRSGRRYRVPYTLGSGSTPSGRRRKPRYYIASAPGEPPAARTGALRASWFPRPRSERHGTTMVAVPGIYSETPYARYLDPELTGTEPSKKIKPRPFVTPIKERAWARIVRIYRRPYLRGPSP